MTETVACGVTNHFVERAMERIGCSEDEARLIGQGLIWAVRNERSDIARFVARVNRSGNRLFLFKHAPTRRVWYALIDTETLSCITVMPPGYTVPRQGKTRLRLKEMDL